MILKILKLSLLLSLTIFISSCNNKSYQTRYQPGAIQVIGNENNAFCFLEFDRIVSKDKSINDAPNSIPVGHLQELLQIDTNGKIKKIKINSSKNIDGVTFHPNSSTVFSQSSEVYLFCGESLSNKDSIFIWDSKIEKFNLLPVDRNAEILKSIDNRSKPSEKIKSLKAISYSSGWKLHESSSSIADTKFTWNDNVITFKIADYTSNFDVVVTMYKDNIELTREVFKYDKHIEIINTQQYEALSRETYGHEK